MRFRALSGDPANTRASSFPLGGTNWHTHPKINLHAVAFARLEKQIPRNSCVGESFTVCCDPEKGAHVSVEGELRYCEFVPKKQRKSKNGDQKIRVAEIHLSKIAKLDRAEKRDSDAPVPKLGPESEAPF
jgi:hypothetical protein